MSQANGASELVFFKTFPARAAAVADPTTTLLLFDRRLLKVSTDFRRFARKFPHRLGLESGERLKALNAFPSLAEKLARLAEAIPPRELTILAVGGGSVGDFAGFFASVYKRGVRLVHVPSTWLAAIDSSHGGKTALNASGAKNQFGTFYPAEHVVLVRSLLMGQPAERAHDAMGELGKIALLQGGALARGLAWSKLGEGALLWEFLEPAIRAKQKVVARDPLERAGHRQILNFGHTMGHVFEAAFGWTHGHAVAQGVFFALEFSLQRGLLSPRDFERAADLLTQKLGLGADGGKRPKLSAATLETLLRADKKRAPGGRSKRRRAFKVTFVFLEKIGRPVRLTVTYDELAREARRQGWIG